MRIPVKQGPGNIGLTKRVTAYPCRRKAKHAHPCSSNTCVAAFYLVACYMRGKRQALYQLLAPVWSLRICAFRFPPPPHILEATPSLGPGYREIFAPALFSDTPGCHHFYQVVFHQSVMPPTTGLRDTLCQAEKDDLRTSMILILSELSDLQAT